MIKGKFGFSISSWIHFGELCSFLKLPVLLHLSFQIHWHLVVHTVVAFSSQSHLELHTLHDTDFCVSSSFCHHPLPSSLPFSLDYSRHKFISFISLLKQMTGLIDPVSYSCRSVLYFIDLCFYLYNFLSSAFFRCTHKKNEF